MKTNELTSIIIAQAIQIHRKPGPGLLESVYQAAPAYELKKAGVPFGLLINFNVLRLKDGLKRRVNNYDDSE